MNQCKRYLESNQRQRHPEIRPRSKYNPNLNPDTNKEEALLAPHRLALIFMRCPRIPLLRALAALPLPLLSFVLAAHEILELRP